MRTLKITIMLLLLVSFIACKKDSVAPQEIDGSFEIRQYVLVTRETNNNNWLVNITVTSFEAQSKSIVFNEGGQIPDNGFTYSYADGILKLLYDGRVNSELRIENNLIASKKLSGITISYQLIKIPNENQFNGNTYNGGWKSEGSLITSIASLKFTDTQYGETSINVPVPNKTYQLFKNIAAYSYDINNRVKSFWVLSDGKLEGYRKYYNSNTSVNGTFSK